MKFRKGPEEDLKVSLNHYCLLCGAHRGSEVDVLTHINDEHAKTFVRLRNEEEERQKPFWTYRNAAAVLTCNHLAVAHIYEHAISYYNDPGTPENRYRRTTVEPPADTVDNLTDAVVHCEVCNKPRHAIKPA